MKKLIFTITILSIFNLNLFSDPLIDLLNESAFGINSGPPTPPPFCGIGWGTSPANQIPDVSLVGDSRSFLLALAEMNGDSSISPQSIDENRSNRLLRKAISDASIYGSGVNMIKILKSPVTLHNLGWAGATATDKEIFLGLQNFIPGFQVAGSGAKNWNRRWDLCRGIYANPYITSPKMILHLGGNDMKDFYQYMKQVEVLYEIIRAISNPVSFLANLFTGRREKENELFWYWQFEAKEDGIVEGMKAYSSKLMEQNGNHAPALNQILLVDVAPLIYQENLGLNVDFKSTLRFNIYLSRLNTKYYNNLFPYLKQKYGEDKIHFLDMFNHFLSNIVGGATYYIPGDGVHFLSGDNRSFAIVSSLGNEQFGKMLAAKMALIGWFPNNSLLTREQLEGLTNGVPLDLTNVIGQCDDMCKVALCFFFGLCHL